MADSYSGVEQPSRRKRAMAVRGEILRSLRMARGWTQEEAAHRGDVSDRVIRKAESGGPVEIKTITALARLYRTSENLLKPEDLVVAPDELRPKTADTEALAARVQRWFDGQWNKLDLSVFDELAIPDFAFHTEEGVVRGVEQFKRRALKLHESFSEIEMVAEEIVDFDGAFMVRWRVGVTHSGTWLDLAPTGKRVVVTGSSWVELVGDKFGEAWDFWDPGLLHLELAGPMS